ncbi:hypothetical protein TWF506_007576 [Arthrobotrys conoides]|uniref:VWFA domain-containing protein n=1 Tax=Arthrobotrys conoides TaxID=74498 RepID=A0AAN8RSY3_9PEZI
MTSRVHLPFELDFSFRLKRARRRSQEYIIPQYPFGKDSLAETNPWSPSTPVISPSSATQTTAQFSFAGLGNTQNFVPPVELPGNTPNIPRPQYQSGVPATGSPGAQNLRPSSWAGAHPELPRIITSPPTMLGNMDPGPNKYFHSPISPPASPVRYVELGLLKLYRTVFIVDDSASMISSNHLKSAYDLLETLVPLVTQVSEKAVDIQFLSDDRQSHTRKIKPGDKLPANEDFYDGVTARKSAAMSAGLKRIIKPYLSGIRKRKVLEKEGLNIIVITDGMRPDKKDVLNYIVSVARKLTEKGAPQHLLGIQFVQVGDDQGAKKFFMTVDDGLEKQYHIRDIVDTVVHTWPGVSLTRDCIEKILLGGISDSKDQMKMI